MRFVLLASLDRILVIRLNSAPVLAGLVLGIGDTEVNGVLVVPAFLEFAEGRGDPDFKQINTEKYVVARTHCRETSSRKINQRSSKEGGKSPSEVSL